MFPIELNEARRARGSQFVDVGITPALTRVQPRQFEIRGPKIVVVVYEKYSNVIGARRKIYRQGSFDDIDQESRFPPRRSPLAFDWAGWPCTYTLFI